MRTTLSRRGSLPAHVVATLLLLAAASLPTAAPADDLVVALAGPMSGRFAARGAEMRAGAELAVEDINAAGGIAGRKLRLSVEDDSCERRKAATAAEALVQIGANLVVGHYCSSSSVAAAPIYARAGIIQITPGATSSQLAVPRAAPTFFRLAGRDDRQGDAAGRYLAGEFPSGRIALIHDRTAFAIAFAEGARRALHAAGLKEVAYEGFVAGEKDYTALAERLKTVGVDSVLIGGYPIEVSLILKAMRTAGVNVPLLASDAIATPEFPAEAGAAAEGTLMMFRPDHRRNRAAETVIARLRARQIEPASAVLATYAAFEAWAAAARRAQAAGSAAVESALAAGPAETVLGPVRFDGQGDADAASFAVHVWRGSGHVPLH